jgi:hypothetical protein
LFPTSKEDILKIFKDCFDAEPRKLSVETWLYELKVDEYDLAECLTTLEQSVREKIPGWVFPGEIQIILEHPGFSLAEYILVDQEGSQGVNTIGRFADAVLARLPVLSAA